VPCGLGGTRNRADPADEDATLTSCSTVGGGAADGTGWADAPAHAVHAAAQTAAMPQTRSAIAPKHTRAVNLQRLRYGQAESTTRPEPTRTAGLSGASPGEPVSPRIASHARRCAFTAGERAQDGSSRGASSAPCA
jgi:hypothetical protein